MNVLFLCRGSISEGLGHLTRTRSVARQTAGNVRVAAIGDEVAERILRDSGLDTRVFPDEESAVAWGLETAPDAVVLDLLKLSAVHFQRLRACPRLLSLSPIFEHLALVDTVYHRSSVPAPEWPQRPPPNFKCGLEYAVIGEHCRRIPARQYRATLQSDPLSIAVSMGGADASNKTLQVIRRLTAFPKKIRVWVMLGEGYTHSYQDLVNSIAESEHEIILAKTNESAWGILSGCALVVLAGGVTSYEACFAGLPSVNLLDDPARQFLIRELVERGAGLCAGSTLEEGLGALNGLIEALYRHRTALLRMHRRAQRLVDDNGSRRIAQDILRGAF